MARMNLSISDRLKEDMDALEGSFNWSSLAAEVFAREVRKSRKVKEMNTEHVVDRLRASYEETKSFDGEDGHANGVEWASESAEYNELVWFEQDGAAQALHEGRVAGPIEDNYGDASSFWECAIGGEEIPSLATVEGFVEGALEVWRKVKDQVRN